MNREREPLARSLTLPGENQAMNTPRTGAKCGCKRGIQRDNCPTCEGTGGVIDFAAIRARRTVPAVIIGEDGRAVVREGA